MSTKVDNIGKEHRLYRSITVTPTIQESVGRERQLKYN